MAAAAATGAAAALSKSCAVNVCDLAEVCDEWFGHDSTLDRVLRDVYYEDEYDNIDEDSDEYDDW